MLALPLQMGRERRERLGPVAVAQVPRRGPTPKHRAAVVRRSVLVETRLVVSVANLASRHTPMAPGILSGTALEFGKLTDNLIFARLAEANAGGIAVGLGVFTKVLKAPVAIPRPLGGFWV